MLHDAKGVEDSSVVTTIVGQQGGHVLPHFVALEATGEAETGGCSEHSSPCVHSVRPLVAAFWHELSYRRAPHTRGVWGDKIAHSEKEISMSAVYSISEEELRRNLRSRF